MTENARPPEPRRAEEASFPDEGPSYCPLDLPTQDELQIVKDVA